MKAMEVDSDIPDESLELCTFDIPNIVAINSRQVSEAALYPAGPGSSVADDDFLLRKTFEATQQLIGELWSLPTMPSDVGPLALLQNATSSGLVDIPRELSPPEAKAETKWEKFAKEKGILNTKRDRKVFDEAAGEWGYRYGYGRVGGEGKEWPIMEVAEGADPKADPWEAARDAKKKKVEKNLGSQLRNRERAGVVAKGTAGRVLRAREDLREKGREGHAAGQEAAAAAGLPVDLPTGSAGGGAKKKGKEGLSVALRAAQSSTASLGRFDAMLQGEPDRPKSLGGRRRKFEDAVSKGAVVLEKERNKKVLQGVLDGTATKSARAKKGDKKLATGETAYDYDYSDGLGEQNFKKKKGRAGMGKMKKITKKQRS